MKHTIFTILLSLTLASLLTGCATQTVGGRGNESLGSQVARHEQQIQGILAQVGQVEQVLPGQAEMWSQMQTMRSELNQIHGQLDNLNMQLGGSGSGELAVMRENIRRLQTTVRQMGAQLGFNVTDLEAPAGYGATAAPPATNYGTQAPYAPPLAPAATAPATPQGNTPDLLYEKGIQAFDQRQYKNAVAAFKDFSANYPQHQLAGNAAFWQGESYYQMKDYGRAALAYQEVLDKHKGSSKYQSALLKQGMSLHYAGKKDAGKQRLQELISRYPSSPEATRAKQFIETNK